MESTTTNHPDKPTSAGRSEFILEEYRALRAEILTRIVIQNSLLVLVLIGFAVFFALGEYQRAPEYLLFYTLFAGCVSAMWAHHGARTVQIRAYVTESLERDASGPAGGGWEHFLRRNRIGDFLGSRWYVSTKGLLLGSQVAAVGLACLQGDTAHVALLIALGAVIIAGTAVVLRKARIKRDAR